MRAHVPETVAIAASAALIGIHLLGLRRDVSRRQRILWVIVGTVGLVIALRT